MALREHLTPKQDAFAMAYVETGNATEAYRRAYSPRKMSDSSMSREAHSLLRHPKITPMIDRLRQAHAEQHDVTVESLTRQLEDARQLAMASKNPSAAVAATMGIAKLHGLLTDKLEHSGKNGAAPSISLTINRRTA
jgi:phage terminase small subunit